MSKNPVRKIKQNNINGREKMMDERLERIRELYKDKHELENRINEIEEQLLQIKLELDTYPSQLRKKALLEMIE